MRPLHELFIKLLSRFTYRQRFLFWSIMFLCAVPWPAYWIFSIQNFNIKLIDQKLASLHPQELLGNILTNVLVSRLSQNNSTVLYKESLDALNELTNWVEAHSTVEKLALFEPTQFVTYDFRLHELNNSLKIIFDEPNEQVLSEARALTINLLKKFIELGYAYNLVVNFTREERRLRDEIMYYLPIEQALVSEIYVRALKVRSERGGSGEQMAGVLAANKQLLDLLSYQNKSLLMSKNEPYVQYSSIVGRMLNNMDPTIIVSDLFKDQRFLIQKAITMNAKSRLEAIESFEKLLKKERKYFVWQRYFVIAVLSTGALIIAAYVYFRILTGHLLQLRQYLDEMAKGNFSPEIAVNLKDSIGQIVVEFEKMKESIKQVIMQLKELGKQLYDLSKKIKRSTSANELAMKEQRDSLEHLSSGIQSLVDKLHDLDQKLSVFSETSVETLFLEDEKKRIEFLPERMNILARASEGILRNLTLVQEEVSSTGRLTKFMAKVSDQAKLLSLNSEIETLSVGPYRAIFSDITMKIQRFAEKTALSTLEIQKIVNDMSKSVMQGKATANTCLKEINVESSRLIAVSYQLGNVSLRGKEQVEQFANIRRMIKSNAQAAESILAAIESLKKLVNQNIEDFQSLLETIQIIDEKSAEHNQMLTRLITLKGEKK